MERSPNHTNEHLWGNWAKLSIQFSLNLNIIIRPKFIPRFNHSKQLDSDENVLKVELQRTNELKLKHKKNDWKLVFFLCSTKSPLPCWSAIVSHSCHRFHIFHCYFLFTFSIFPMCLHFDIFERWSIIHGNKCFRYGFLEGAQLSGLHHFLQEISIYIFVRFDFSVVEKYARVVWFFCLLNILLLLFSFPILIGYSVFFFSSSSSRSLHLWCQKEVNFHIKRFWRRYNEVDLTNLTG